MHRIVTITLNPAVDRTIRADRFRIGEHQPARTLGSHPAGKGVNVSRTLAVLGTPSVCTGFVGRKELAMFEEYLERAGKGTVTTQLLVVRARTRDNITITDPTDDTETHLRDVGFSVTRQDVQRILSKASMLAREDSVICICGSIPPGVTRGDIRSILQACHDNGAHAAIDTSARVLKALRSDPLWMAKLNHRELAAFANAPTENQEQTVAAARKLAEKNGGSVTHVIASRGAEGVVYIGPHHELIGRVFVHPGRINSTVGSGDALLAGILHARYNKQPWPDAIVQGLAAATANAVARQPGTLDHADIDEFLQLATITNIDPENTHES